MYRAILLLLTGLLAGCVNQLALREARLRQFIGQPEAALVQQMGVPNRVYETGGVKYLAYDEHSVDVIPGFPTYNPYFAGWYAGGFPPQVVLWPGQAGCEPVDPAKPQFVDAGEQVADANDQWTIHGSDQEQRGLL